MSIKTIPCGGFMYDDDDIIFEKDEYGRSVIKSKQYDAILLQTGTSSSDWILAEGNFDDILAKSHQNKPINIIAIQNTAGAYVATNIGEIMIFDSPSFPANYIQCKAPAFTSSGTVSGWQIAKDGTVTKS